LGVPWNSFLKESTLVEAQSVDSKEMLLGGGWNSREFCSHLHDYYEGGETKWFCRERRGGGKKEDAKRKEKEKFGGVADAILGSAFFKKRERERGTSISSLLPSYKYKPFFPIMRVTVLKTLEAKRDGGASCGRLAQLASCELGTSVSVGWQF